MNKQSGITLLEILVGVAIFSVALSLAGGVFSSVVRYHKKAEVSRQIGEDIRNSISQIVNDVRQSSGETGINTDSGLEIANFAALSSSDNPVDSPTTVANRLIVSISDNQRRKYFVSNQGDYNSIMVQEVLRDDSNRWQTQDPQLLTGQNIDVKTFNLSASQAVAGADDQIEPETKVYPWLKIEIEADYIDQRSRKELESEKVSFSTVISSRDFSFW